MELAGQGLLLDQTQAAAQEPPRPVHRDRALPGARGPQRVDAPDQLEALRREVGEHHGAPRLDDANQFRERGAPVLEVMQHVDADRRAEVAVGKRQAAALATMKRMRREAPAGR